MKCWYLAFNAQGSRQIIVVAPLRLSENICSTSGGAQEKERHDKTQFTIKIDGLCYRTLSSLYNATTTLVTFPEILIHNGQYDSLFIVWAGEHSTAFSMCILGR